MNPELLLHRRRFLALAGGAVVTACSGGIETTPTGTPSSSTRSSTSAPAATSSDPGPDQVDTATVAETRPATERVLVVVSLDGGNDAVNTMPPDLGSYRDLRPNLALAESQLVRSETLPSHGLHPALAPLVTHLEDGRLALIAGIGFPSPDRSHFTSTDRWHRADRMDAELGWLGRWLDTLPTDPPPLGATSLGGGGAVLVGATRQGADIAEVDAFAFPDEIDHADIRALAGADRCADGCEAAPSADLFAAARAGFAASVGVVEEFDAVADAARRRADADTPGTPGPFVSGLAVAAELITGPTATRVVTVTVGGFDTHSRQIEQHDRLLADLALGLDRFWTTLDTAGVADDVLVITTSEFGRRVAENGSAGTDHGAAGLSFVMGNAIRGGVHGAIDTDDVVDGDLAPIFDPRAMYTVALDWLGADADAVLGGRWDDLDLLR